MTAVVIEWHGCYDDAWKGLIVPDAFAHPAKFARGLVERIVSFGLEEGFWRKDDTVLDPFGGVGCGGIICASHGLRWLGVELEARFVNLARQNFELHRPTWEAFGDPLPVIVQGDSRQLGDVLREAGALVSSPPYSEGLGHGGRPGNAPHDTMGTLAAMEQGYGASPGQLGAMPAGSVEAVVTSPPYSSGTVAPATTKSEESIRTYYEAYRARGGGWSYERFREDVLAGKRGGGGSYGTSDGNLANLPAGMLSSPPYEGNHKSDYLIDEDTKTRSRDMKRGHRQGAGCFRGSEAYGDTPGQMGRERSETFWEAARDVLLSCHAVLAPGAVTAWVVKDFVRKRVRVPFTEDWARLLESCGFSVFLEAQASLVKDERRAGLFGEVGTKRERKSFFRRLAEKRGSPRIDYESVLWARMVRLPTPAGTVPAGVPTPEEIAP